MNILTDCLGGKKSMASNPLFKIPDFFFAFSISCLSLVLLNWGRQQGRPFSLPSQRNFLISFKPSSNSWVLLENAKKNLEFHFGGERHASFLQKPVVKNFGIIIFNFMRQLFHKMHHKTFHSKTRSKDKNVRNISWNVKK